MTGHNKWSKVKHIKARVDARNDKVFSRFSHEISIATHDGGGDPDLNPRLRSAIEGAKTQSMPKDNTNRSAAKVREIFTKNGGSIATPGSESYQFDRKGEVRISAEGNSEEAGADDIQSDSEQHVIYSEVSRLNAVAAALGEAGMTPVSRQLVSVPQNPSIIKDVTAAKQALRLYELLNDYEDTMDAFTNFEISDQVLAKLDA